jgi:hypothetical protein
VVRGKDPFIYDKAKEVLTQFKGYKNKGLIQLAVLRYFVANLMDRRELDYYKEIFFHLNFSFTGQLTREEILSGFWKNGVKEMNFFTIDKILC